ncbi:MAG: signal peptide peptidase SppA [Burkholderiaceae bacterium]|nr:signal peptide peptidase SppA [Burkholderiaceae bacterium]
MSIKTLFSPLWWLVRKAWNILDAGRRALFNLLLLALLVTFVAALLNHGPKPLKDKTTLVLNLQGTLVEQFSGSPREQAMAELQGQQQRQTRLRDVLRVLDAAAKDSKITTLALELDDFSGAGMAGLHEVADALARFKASGKSIVAYGDSYSQRAYLLAAQANEIYLNPLGMVMIEGFGRQRAYYKDALDRLGITVNLLRVGTFKSYGEPYVANGPSKAALEADSYLYDDLWARYTRTIEQARKLDQGAINADINQLPQTLAALKGNTAQMALQEKLIDGIKTRDEVRALLIKKGAPDDKGHSYRRITFNDYLANLKPRPEQGPAVGVVVAEGDIVDGDASPGRIGGDSTAQLIRQAREDEQTKAIVLRVNSPGGSAFASEIVRRELELTRQAGKPVVVSMGDVAASGGYWISMASDEVIADPATVTGSIGVFGILPTGEKLMDKLSIHTGGYQTTWLAGGFDPRRALDPRLAASVQAAIQHIYDEFTGKAAGARKKTVTEIDAVAQGRVWSGQQALDRGLVDRLGSLDDAIHAAATRAKLEGTPRVHYVEKELGRWERVIEGLQNSAVDALAAPVAQALRAAIGISIPPALQQAQADLAFAAELGQDHKPYAAVVHCLCAAP